MTIQCDPLYSLFQPESVCELIAQKTGAEGRYEYRMLRDLLLLNSSEDPEAAIADYIEKTSPAKMAKAVHYWKSIGIAASTAGRKVIITGDILRNSADTMRLKEYPQKLYETINYYRDVTYGELLYLINWAMESGIQENGLINGVNDALSINPGITLPDMIDFIANHMNAEEKTEHEKNYRTATEIIRSLNQEGRLKVKEVIQYVEKWREAGFTKTDMLLACSRAVESQEIRYLDAILANARKSMEQANIRTYNELLEVTDDFKNLLNIAGKEYTTPENIARFVSLKRDYPDELIRLAGITARENYPDRTAAPQFVLYIQRVLEQWKEKKLHTAEEVKAYLYEKKNIEALMRSITETAGFNLNSYEEQRFKRSIQIWKREGYANEQILDAAQKAVEAQDPVRYISALLGSEENVLPL